MKYGTGIRFLRLFTHISRVSVLVALSFPAYSITVMPMSGELDLGVSESYIMQVFNKSDKAVPVKVTTYNWSQDATGMEVRTPTSDLRIFPTQFMLRPNEKRTFRVTPRNQKIPDVEKAYRIMVEEIPVKEAAKQGVNIRVVTRYLTAFYVTPKKPESRISVKSVKRNDKGLQMTLTNSGTAHSHIVKPALTFKQGKYSQKIDSPDDLKALTSTNVHAGATHVVQWNWPEKVLAKIDLTKKYQVNMSWECEFCRHKRTESDFTVD